MFLIIISIVCGLLGELLTVLLTMDGSQVSESFVFAMWIIGFFSPGLYVLEQLYQVILRFRWGLFFTPSRTLEELIQGRSTACPHLF